LKRRFTANWTLLFRGVLALLCLGLVCCHRAGQPHWVTLTWEAPAPVPGSAVVGYNIYRSTTSGGPYAKIASDVPRPLYDDRIVTSGRTYFYVVTAVDQAGHESRFSGEVKAEVP
jgi:fibronectin type 3 domain-containing protein